MIQTLITELKELTEGRTPLKDIRSFYETSVLEEAERDIYGIDHGWSIPEMADRIYYSGIPLDVKEYEDRMLC
jgi:hypothetical protein